MRDPGNPMATFVIAQLDAAIDLFTSLIQHGANTPRYRRNLQWLLKLRVRALSKIPTASIAQDADSQRDAHRERQRSREDREDSEDVELLGWRTRLIERAGQDHQTIRTIHLHETPTGSDGTNNSNLSPSAHNFGGAQGELGTANMMVPNSSLSLVTPDSTAELVRSTSKYLFARADALQLQDFWDPMLLQDIFGASAG